MNKPWEHWWNKRGDEIKRCDKCGVPLHWDLLTELKHDEDICLGRQLQQARAEIKKLKASVDAWKDAWFQLREIIGYLWWHHPAISDESQLQQYQNNLIQLKEKKYETGSC